MECNLSLDFCLQLIHLCVPLLGNGTNKGTHYLIVGPLPSNRPKRTYPKENAPAAQQQPTVVQKHTYLLIINYYYYLLFLYIKSNLAGWLTGWTLGRCSSLADQCCWAADQCCWAAAQQWVGFFFGVRS
jgi:hypothetical protein